VQPGSAEKVTEPVPDPPCHRSETVVSKFVDNTVLEIPKGSWSPASKVNVTSALVANR
jgi:hypothetical protein